jgi:hypothetical protein
MKFNFNATTAPAQSPRSVTGRNIAHAVRDAGARAFLAADLVRGTVVLEKPTIVQACEITGVWYPYVRAALLATPAERFEIERGARSFGSLYAEKTSAPAPSAVRLEPVAVPATFDDMWAGMDDVERQAWAADHSDELWGALDHATAAVVNSTGNGKFVFGE